MYNRFHIMTDIKRKLLKKLRQTHTHTHLTSKFESFCNDSFI